MEPAGPPRPQPMTPLVQRPTPLAQGQIVPIVPEKKTSWIWSVLLILLFSTLVGFLTFVWLYVYPRVGNQIVVENQVIESLIHVDKISLNTKAFLVIQSLKLNNETFLISQDSHLANTKLLLPGVYEDFDLPLAEATDLGPTPGIILFATLYKDINSNGIYDIHEDMDTLTDLLGNPIRIQFQAK